MIYVLYNPLSNNNKGEEALNKIDLVKFKDEVSCYSVVNIDSYKEFFKQIKNDDKIVLCGGDGTINKFINNTKDLEINNDILYYPLGTGNDFYRDVTGKSRGDVIKINEYIKSLPTVIVNNKEYKFINGVGFGIDGYCCEVGDKLREKNAKKINYTTIAIKGLLFNFKPVNARIIVDNKEFNYNKVWIAPTMKGKFYGGGMTPAPNQNRDKKEVTLMVFHGSGKLKTLMIFPSLFKGKHVKRVKNISLHTGKSIVVKFDKPTSLQIDGETILGVSEYKVIV